MITTIGVYKTDVLDRSRAKAIVAALQKHFPGCDASFDLEDCDNVLRVESSGNGIDETKIRRILQEHGHQIEELPF